MKPGDLRRFHSNINEYHSERKIAGKVLMITDVDSRKPPAWISVMFDGEHADRWAYDFVNRFSEPV